MGSRQIVIFSALYPPHLGGVEKYTQSIAGELAKDSHLTVFCMNTEKQPEYSKQGDVEVFSLPCFALQKGRFPVPKISAIRIVQDWFQHNQADFGIVQCRFYLLSLLGCRFFAKYRIPFIQIEHGAGDITFTDPVVNWLWHMYDNLLTLLEKRIPHDFYAVSRAGLRWLEHYGIRGKGVIPNSVNPCDFEKFLTHPGVWRKAHDIPDDALIIAFTGRIMQEKGVLDLLDAFDRLNGESLFLVMAGDGDMKLIQPWMDRKNILFPGQIPFSEVASLLADTAVFCLPSHFTEGMPTGVLEAGCCGAAVVASDGGGTAEIIPDREHGWLIPSGNVDELAEALQWYIDHPEERARVGSKLRARVLDLFTWNRAARLVVDAMEMSLQSFPHPR